MVRQEAGTTGEVRRAIREIVEEPGAALVARYYADERFAGVLFDEFGENPTDRFTADDLIAVSLLDVRFGPEAVRALLVDRVADSMLTDVPGDRLLWAVDYDAVLSVNAPAGQLWKLLTDLHGVGGTRASKLLARKRPTLLPILDSVIRERLHLGYVDAWRALHDALADEETRSAVDGLASMLDGPTPTTLRLLDVATWMRFSESDSARSVRRTLGLPVQPR